MSDPILRWGSGSPDGALRPKPRRWLDDGSGATRRERDLLRAGLDVDPPPDAQAKAWAGLLLQIGPPVGPGGPSGGALPTAGAGGAAAAGKAAGALGLAGVVKAMIVGGAAAGIFVASYAAVVPAPAPRPEASMQVAMQPAGAQAEAQRGAPAMLPAHTPEEEVPARANAPRPATPAIAPNEPRTAGAAAPIESGRDAPLEGSSSEGSPASADLPAIGGDGSYGSAPADVAAAERTTRLREERRMLEEARDALRSGDASGALSRLEQARARFPGGVLIQEREALVIEALYRSGQRAAASARAAAFLRAYPMSPHAARIQSFVQ